MATLTPIQQLDEALKFLNSRNKRYIGHDELKEECFKNNDSIDVEAIILKLTEDKYIHPALSGTPDYHKFKISIFGQVFIANKGYEGVINRDDDENIRADKIEHAQRDFRRTQNVLLIFVAVGTSIAGVYYLTELYWKYHWFH